MSIHHERDPNNNEGKMMMAAAILIAGIIVTAGLLSALSIVGSLQQPALAQQQQQNMTGGIEVGTDNQTSSSTARTTDVTTSTIGDAGQGGNATTNITSLGGARLGENQSEIRMHIEEARAALQNNDTQSALMHLDLVLNALGMTTNNTVAGSNATIITGSNQEEILASIEDESNNNEDGEGGAQGNNDDEDSSAADSDDNTGNDATRDTIRSTDANNRETNTEREDSECGAVNIGGTSPADDYGCPPDPDY